MTITFLLKGFLLGLSLGAPTGAIGALCIRRALTKRPLSGLVSQLGAATVDGIYSLIAGLGISAVSQFLLRWQSTMKLTGGLFLLYLGIKLLFNKPTKYSTASSSSSLFRDYLSTVLLTISNPTTILTFVAMFAGLGLASTSDHYLSTILLISGVVAGSACWGVCFMIGAKLFGRYLSEGKLVLINLGCSLIMVTFGLIALMSIFTT